MLIRDKDALDSSHHVETDLWQSVRLLLARDGYGLTITDVTIRAGSDAIYGYEHHTEICYCLEGDATFEDLGSGQIYRVGPGTLWAVHPRERFRFAAHTPTRLISVFSPALIGPEMNDEKGSFPPAGEVERSAISDYRADSD